MQNLNLVFFQEILVLYKLLSIAHEIYESFDRNLETRGIFLDISKAFDRVWHQGLLFKLKSNGIEAILKKLFVSGVAPGYDFKIIIFYPPARYIFCMLLFFLFIYFLNVLL